MSVEARSGIGLAAPWRKSTGISAGTAGRPRTSVPASECSAIDAIVAVNGWTAMSISGIGGAEAGSAKYDGQTRRKSSNDSSGVAVPASSFASISRTRARSFSLSGACSRSPNSGITSKCAPSGSTMIAPATRSGIAASTWRARCPPQECPTIHARPPAVSSITAAASATFASTVNGPSTVVGARPRCW